MAEEENTTEETPADEAPEAAAEAPAEEAPAEEAASEEAPVEEAPAEEPEVEEPEADAPAAEERAPAAESADDSEPAEELGPKERRKLERSTHTGEAGPERSVEDRIADREAGRSRQAAERRRRRASERSKRGESGTGTPATDREAGIRKEQLGTVVSDKADKTITVRVDIVRRHRRYEKVVRRSATVHAHDEQNEAGEGDVVRVIESRPLSRTKRWRLIEVVEKAR